MQQWAAWAAWEVVACLEVWAAWEVVAWEVVACLEAWVGVCLAVWVEAEGGKADAAGASSSQ